MCNAFLNALVDFLGGKSPGDERLHSNKANTSYLPEENNRNVVVLHYFSRFTTIHASRRESRHRKSFSDRYSIAKPASFFSIIPKEELQPWGL